MHKNYMGCPIMANELKTTQSNQSSEVVSFSWIQPEEGVCEVYSNFHHVNWTLFDVRVRYGQIIPHPQQQPDKAVWAVEEYAAVTIPWGQAKALRDMLTEAIRTYEAVNGEIKLPVLPT